MQFTPSGYTQAKKELTRDLTPICDSTLQLLKGSMQRFIELGQLPPDSVLLCSAYKIGNFIGKNLIKKSNKDLNIQAL